MNLSTPRKVLLTGATGFLGSHLAHALIERDVSLHATRRTHSSLARLSSIAARIHWINSDEGNLSSALQAIAPLDCIIHCATNYGRHDPNPIATIESNLILPLQLLELGSRSGLRCFINTDTYLDKGINYYSLSKKQFSEWLESYQHELACVNLVLEHFYGPHDNKSKFVTWLTDALMDGVERIPLTEGRQRRDFIYIDDVVEAFLAIIAFAYSASGFHRFNVGSGTPISIRDFAELAKRLAGNSRTMLEFGAVPYRPGEIMDTKVDIEPLLALGWKPRVGLIDGLRKTIDAKRGGS